MQVIPALPWDKGAGGQIKFSEPISIEDLLVGRVKLGLDYNGEVAENVRFYRAPNSDTVTVMSGGSTVFGVSLNGNTLTLNYIYQDDSYNLESVELVELPNISTYPSLPWTTAVNDGIIKLQSPVTFEQLKNGALAFQSNNYGQWYNINSSGSGSYEVLVLLAPNTTDAVYIIRSFDGSTNLITLERVGSAGNNILKTVVKYYGALTGDLIMIGENGEPPVNGEVAYPVMQDTATGEYCALTQDGITVLKGIYDNTADECVDLEFSGALGINTKFDSVAPESIFGDRLLQTELVNQDGTIKLHIMYPDANVDTYFSLNSVGASSPASLYAS